MTSDPPLVEASTAFVWIWLPQASEPVVCGRLDDADGVISFTYARSYLERDDSIPLFEPELPLTPGPQFSADGNRLPLCIDDAMPDSWGRRLVNHRIGLPNSDLNELTYLLESGTDRIGALGFQDDASSFVRRESDHPDIEELADAASRIEEGRPLSPALTAALLRGTSIGGARPKAILSSAEGPGAIVKFSSTTDTYPVVQAEFVAMELARRCGLDVAPVELTRVANRWALLVERFDRGETGERHHMVSALTVLGLSAWPGGRYATYSALADEMRKRFVEADGSLRELFGRIAFNILSGNTDDHGRNHSAFVRGPDLALTPAYDICPQLRTGGTAEQAMAYGRSGERTARVADLVAVADVYHLDTRDAAELVEGQIEAIREQWTQVCELADLGVGDRDALMGRQFLNPFALEGWSEA